MTENGEKPDFGKPQRISRLCCIGAPRLSFDELRKNTERAFDYNGKGSPPKSGAAGTLKSRLRWGSRCTLICLQMASLGRKRSLAKGSSGKRIMFREPTAAHFPGSALSRVFQPPPDK
jgi:hypothetical protein